MGNVFSEIGVWVKKGFFVLTAVAIAGLNLLMLLDVFQGNILFVILGMSFFSIATWVYMVTAFSASEHSSGIQLAISWVGLLVSLLGELTMGGFEILRMQSFIEPPAWINTVTIMVIEMVIIFHLLLGIVYFAASLDYNQRLNRIFEASKRAKAEEMLREHRAKAEIKIQEDATTQGVALTRSMLEAALPIVAEQKARLMAQDIARAFGLDADPAMNSAFENAIADYRAGFHTRALSGGTPAHQYAAETSNVVENPGVIMIPPVEHPMPITPASDFTPGKREDAANPTSPRKK